jgi:hypothetical protein
MLLLSDLGPYPLNQYGREKGMIHRGPPLDNLHGFVPSSPGGH